MAASSGSYPSEGSGPPPGVHVLAAVIVAGALALARWAPDRYAALVQEDRAVEWWTVGLFGAAAVVRLWTAARTRRAFDLLVGLFCLFVAGEEMSWGQRLIGYTPPAVFLEHNTQQEATLHNFADVFGKPKWILALALAGYGMLLPVLRRPAPGRRLLERLGATAPPLELAPWFGAAVILLCWYPVTFTGEWVELLAGALFVASAGLRVVPFRLAAGGTLAAGLLMAEASARSRTAEPDLACARAEVGALLLDVAVGGASTRRLERTGAIHKRVWTAARDGYLEWNRLAEFRDAPCAGAAVEAVAARRRYAIDPWGSAYWIRVEREYDGGRRAVVYSFGPNRRRDGPPGSGRGDDVSELGAVSFAVPQIP